MEEKLEIEHPADIQKNRLLYEKCALELFRIGAVKFGSFTLKSGMVSAIYIDLRLIISYPALLKEIADLLFKKVSKETSFDLVIGVPYTALPIATALSLEYGVPMLMRRKEPKEYGTKKIIEGVFKENQRCLVIEDLITSGQSVFETIEPLKNAGLLVSDVAVVLDREQGGRKRIEEKGIRLHSLFKISDLLGLLLREEMLEEKIVVDVQKFLAENQC